jgi:hypothetical protein
MVDEVNAEFASYREMLRTEEEKQAFDKLITQRLEERGRA